MRTTVLYEPPILGKEPGILVAKWEAKHPRSTGISEGKPVKPNWCFLANPLPIFWIL